VSTIQHELDELRARGLYRQLREVSRLDGRIIEIAGRELINFGSNDYLGLATEPSVCAAAQEAIARFGVGTGSSRLICGTFSPHVQLEEALAKFKQTEAALAFSSGYAAAVGTLGALLRREDVVVLDKLCHASLVDGARSSGAILRIFPHNHLGKLESHLQWARKHYAGGRVLVVTESLFSMDGDSPPLREIVELKDRFGAMLLLDEAHAIGVLGPQGRGYAEALGLGARIDIQMGTLSKALGSSGGYIAGSRRLIDLLINRARSFIYSTSPPPAAAAAAQAALELVQAPEGAARRKRLSENIQTFSEGAASRASGSQIIPLVIGGSEAALALSRALFAYGYFVPALRYPTVPARSARIRVTLTSRQTSEEVRGLRAAITECREVSE
jgi:8-amino-7-oxononanoate synthase